MPSIFDFFSSKRSLENPAVSFTDAAAWEAAFYSNWSARAGEKVDEAAALSVPAIWQAINVIAGTIAHLPLHLYKLDRDGTPIKAKNDPLYTIVHDRVSDVHTSGVWRKWLVTRLLIDGRALSLIVRDKARRATGFLPLPLHDVRITQTIANGRVSRTYTVKGVDYPHTDIIDIANFPKGDLISVYSPIEVHRDAIGLIIAAESYASRLFANGGVPPLVLKGPMGSPAANDRATAQINDALRIAKNNKRNVLATPAGYELQNLGFDPMKQQLLELRRFQISEVSRIFNVAPAILHDLTTGTYSNVEMQNLSFAQQTLTPLLELIEQELNLKLFGARNTTNFVEFNLDGIVRGDLVSRMTALASAVSTGIRTPNEARALDNLAPLEGGDVLYVNGGTVPLTMAGQVAAPLAPDPAPAEPTPEPEQENEETDPDVGEA